MTRHHVVLFSSDKSLVKMLAAHLPTNLADVEIVDEEWEGQRIAVKNFTIALVDASWGGSRAKLQDLLEKIFECGIYSILVDQERPGQEVVPVWLESGLVDDLLLTPLRPVELLGKLKHVSHLLKMHEVHHLNADLKQLIERFESDIRVTRSVQRQLIPDKFPPVPGFQVTHKYLSGMKSGGDYLDFFPFDDGTHVGILMSDSTGYGMSSAFTSVVLRLAMKFSKEEGASPSKVLSRILSELQLAMKPTERLELFFGVLNRKTLELAYTSVGSAVHALLQSSDQSWSGLAGTVGALTKEALPSPVDARVSLHPGQRMVLASDGFVDALKGSGGLEAVLERAWEQDALEVLNEAVAQVHKHLESEDDMPEQDCSLMIIDVEKRVMRLAKG